MKKLLTAFLIFAALALTACNPEEEEFEGTYLILEQWPENVSSIQTYNDYGTDCIYPSDPRPVELRLGKYWSNLGEEDLFPEKINLKFYYKGIKEDESEEWLCHGNTTTDENPFRVFIDGEEFKNEAPLIKRFENSCREPFDDSDDEPDLNVFESYLITGIKINGRKEIRLSFENSPRKISHSEVRLNDEQIYAYIDLSGIDENLEISNFSEMLADGSYNRLYTITPYSTLYFFNKYSQTLRMAVWPKNNFYISEPDFAADFDYLEFETTRTSPSYYTCNINLGTPPKKGQIIKITGGTTEEIDSTLFKGKSFTSTSIKDKDDTLTSITSSLTLNDDYTMNLTFNGIKYSGTWYMVDTEHCEIEIDDWFDYHLYWKKYDSYYTMIYYPPTHFGDGIYWNIVFTAEE